MNRIALLMLTYNRLEYVKMSLDNLFTNTNYPYDLWIIDNYNEKDDTRKYLIDLKKKESRITKLILNDTNEGLSKPTNQFWRETNTEIIGKVDNDTLVPKGWLTKLMEALDKVPQLMLVAAIHFWNWVPDIELKEFNGIGLYLPSHMGGCCYLMRSNVIDKIGYLNEQDGHIFGWTLYQEQMRKKGMLIAYHSDIHVELLGGETHSPKSLDKTDPKYIEYNEEIYKMRRGHL